MLFTRPLARALSRAAASAVVVALAAAPAQARTARLSVSLTSKPANPTTATTASFAWSTAGNVVSTTCKLDGASSPCASPSSNANLSAGPHSFAVTVSDGSRTASTSYSWSVSAPAPTPTPSPSPSPGAGGTPLWTGSMENGSLSDWYWPSANATGGFGGGEYDSGSGVASASTERAHSGTTSAKLTLTNGVGGTRLFRWRELRSNRTTTSSVWMYIPTAYTLTGDPNTGRYWIIDEYKSRTADNARNDPFWYVNAFKRADGTMGARLSWGYQSQLEGPHQGETGWRNYGDVTLPVGRWFRIDSTITQSKDFDGAISVTIDGRQLASLTGVRTGWSNCTYNSWCVEQHWAVTNYSDGIAETPASIYVDDASVSVPAAGLRPALRARRRAR